MVRIRYGKSGRETGKERVQNGRWRTALQVVGLTGLTFNLQQSWNYLVQLDPLYELMDSYLEPDAPELTRSHIPEEHQWTVLDYNYSTVNRGSFDAKTHQWKSIRNQSNIPPLFMDRLNHYLPNALPLTTQTDTPPVTITLDFLQKMWSELNGKY